MVRLLGGIEDILEGQFSMPEQREMVVPSSPGASPSRSADSPLVNPGSDFVSGGAPSSPGGSLQRVKPSLINEIGNLSHSPSIEAYAPGWAITKDSLLSEDNTTQEWSRCAHYLAPMSSLMGQSRALMADEIFYDTAHNFSLMVAAADWVCLASVSQGQLKIL